MAVKNSDFEPSSNAILQASEALAKKLRLPMIISENLLLAILSDSTSKSVTALKKYVNIDDLSAKIIEAVSRYSIGCGNSPLLFSPEMKIIFEDALREMKDHNATAISVEHLLLGILRSPHCSAGMYLSYYGINYSMIKDTLDKMKVASVPVAPEAKAKTTKTPASKEAISSRSCGTGCGCHSSVATSLTDAIANRVAKVTGIAQNIGNKDKERNEWIKVLDEAMTMAAATGVSVPASFVQLSFANQSKVDSIFVHQLRKETISEIIENLIQHT